MATRFISVFLLAALLSGYLSLSHAAETPANPPPPAQTAAPAVAPQLIVQDGRPRPAWEFWRGKTELLKKIREDRTISVSVHRTDLPNHLVEFTMNGVGVVNRPMDACFVASQKYDKLTEVSEHFKSVQYDGAARLLELTIEILSYQTQMTLLMTPVMGASRSELQWQVVAGKFKGMTGLVGYEPDNEKATWMSFHAIYQASELPLPKALMGFTLEVVTEKVAQKMRSFIEAQPQAVAAPPLLPAGK